MRVLLIEGKLLDARRVCEALDGARSARARADVQIETVSTIAAAIAQLRQTAVDVVLLDLSLVDGAALDAIERLRTRGADVPIVVVAGNEDEQSAIDAVRHGAQDYLLEDELSGTLMIRSLPYAIDRKRSAQAIARSVSVLQATLESTADGILVVDANGLIVTVNSRLLEMWVVPEDVGEARNDNRLLTFMQSKVRDPETFLSRVWEVYVEPNSESSDVIHLLDGRVLERVSRPQRVEGWSVGRVWSFRDVTDRWRAEQELRESSDRFRLMVEGSEQVFFYSHDVAHVFTYLSPSVADVLGYTPDMLLGRPFDELMYGDESDAEALRLTDEALKARRGRQTYSLEVRHRDGSPVTLEIVESPILRDGVVGGLQGFARDVTDRKHMIDELARSEESYRSFVENSPFGIYRARRDGTILEANPSIVRMLGFSSPSELRSRNMSKDIYAEPDERSAFVAETLRDGRAKPRDFTWKRKDGSTITVRISGHIVWEPDGTLRYWEGYAEDVTPLRAVEHSLRQAEKLAAVGQLISGVAHELNNPLSAITLFVDNLLQDPRSAEDTEALQIIREQTERSRSIVRDLLSAVGSRDKQRAHVPIAELVDRTVRALRPQLERIGVGLDLIPNLSRGVVHADAAGLEQVITNLVINGAHSAGTGGTVRVSIRTVSDGPCAIEVEDTGQGIPREILPRIFEPFFTTKAPGEGTGLGLSVSLGIVEQFGGMMSADNGSALRDGGARFTVTLPCKIAGESSDVDPAEAGIAADTPATQPAQAPVVLVIDDESAIRNALSRFFTRRGWQVVQAADGREALTALAAGRGRATFALIISDLRMPELSGMELHDRIADEFPELLSRLVVSTGDTASPDASAFIERTQCRVLQKPFTLATLADVVAQVVGPSPTGA